MTSKTYEILFSSLSTILTWYCYALFMPFLIILTNEFFHCENILLSTSLSFLMFGAGLFFRPFGALIFGPIGDKFGRHKAITATVLTMAIPTICIAIIPKYCCLGILASILIVICRIIQGISMGGSYAAAMVHIVEQAPSNKRGLYGCVADIGNQVGVLLGSQSLLLLYSFFTEQEIYAYAWRIPFAFAVILIPFAFMPPKSDIVKKKDVKTLQESVPIRLMFKSHRTEMLHTISITAFSAIAFYTLTVFIPFYYKSHNILSLKEATLCGIAATAAMVTAIPIAGYLSDKYKRKNNMIFGVIGVLLTLCCMFLWPTTSYKTCITLNILYGTFMGIYYSARAAFFSESFPKNVRCTAVSVSLSISQAVFGGLTPLMMNIISDISPVLIILPLMIVTFFTLNSLNQIKDRTGQELL